MATVFHAATEPNEQTVVLTGGVRTLSGALVGPVAVRSLPDLNLDLVFLGVHGMAAGAGFTTPNLMEADTNRRAGRSGPAAGRGRRRHEVGHGGRGDVRSPGGGGRARDRPRPARDARRTLGEHVGELIVAGEDSAEQPA